MTRKKPTTDLYSLEDNQLLGELQILHRTSPHLVQLLTDLMSFVSEHNRQLNTIARTLGPLCETQGQIIELIAGAGFKSPGTYSAHVESEESRIAELFTMVKPPDDELN